MPDSATIPYAKYTYTIDESTIILGDAVFKGYTFEGWYDNIDCTGDKITEIEPSICKDITLYPNFEIITYTITYVCDHATNPSENPTSYTVDLSYYILLEAIPETGYNFEGWYDNASFSGNEIINFYQPEELGSVTLYAKITTD